MSVNGVTMGTGSVTVGSDDLRIIIAEFTNAPDAARIISGGRGKAFEMHANASLYVALRNSLPEILSALRVVEVMPTLAEAFAEFVTAVEAHVNEHGGGGYVLARLSDAREALAALQSAKAPT